MLRDKETAIVNSFWIAWSSLKNNEQQGYDSIYISLYPLRALTADPTASRVDWRREKNKAEPGTSYLFLFCWHPRATSQGRDPPSRLRGLPGSRLCTFDGRMFCGGAWPKAVDQFRPLSLSLSLCSFIVHFSLDIGIDKQRRQVNLPIHSALVDRMGIAKKRPQLKIKKFNNPISINRNSTAWTRSFTSQGFSVLRSFWQNEMGNSRNG